MTNEEAIKTIKTAIAEVEWNYPMDYAVAFEAAVSALEKQIPKKIVTKRHFEFCPNCNTELTHLDYYYVKTHCCECGQALDWGDTECIH